MCRSTPNPHVPAHGGFVNLWHEDHDCVGGLSIELDGSRARDAADIAGKLHDCHLHAQADSKEGFRLHSRPRRRCDLSLDASRPKATGNQDGIGATELMPSFMKGLWR